MKLNYMWQILTVMIFVFSFSLSFAQENDDLDDILGGFDDEKQDITIKTTTYSDRFWRVAGSISLSPSYNINHDGPEEGGPDYRGLTRFRLKADLELDLDLPKSWQIFVRGSGFYDFAYRLKDRDDFNDDILDEYESEIELRETYLQGTLLPNLDVKLGRQIVNWSRADNIRVLDVLNPLDMREPGMVDIEDLRLPAAMSRLDYLLGKWTLTGIAIHEIRMTKEPVPGSEFYPQVIALPEKEPETKLKNTEFGAALSGYNLLRGVDASFHFARVFNDQFHVGVDQTGNLERQYALITMIGGSVAVVKESWLFKIELAYFDDLKFLVPTGLLQFGTVEKSRIDALAGIEYSGFTNVTISVDAVNRHLLDYDDALEINQVDEDDFQWMIMYQQDFKREMLHLAIVGSLLGLEGEKGASERVSLEYDWSDYLSMMGGVVLYQGGDNPLYEEAEDNDRLYLEVKYSF